tara:strand:+ start:519 stop:1208 length:690 start_codon:yes stop_codon:yes gene_type:complete
MKIFSIGCSWNESWPDFINDNKDVTKVAMHGKGIKEIYNKMLNQDLKEYDYVVVQLPTPIRSFKYPELSGVATRQYHINFVNSFNEVGEDTACNNLLNSYKDDILLINSLHDNVIIFLYNTGGYPLRHPFDFGENIDYNFVDFFKNNNLKHVYLTFESIPGHCRHEEEWDDPEFKDYVEKSVKRMLDMHGTADEKWVWHHPDNIMIFDAHPSKKSNLVAAKKIEEFIDG